MSIQKLISTFFHYRQRKHIENINRERWGDEDYTDDERLVTPSSSSEEENETPTVTKVMQTMDELKLYREYTCAVAILGGCRSGR